MMNTPGRKALKARHFYIGILIMLIILTSCNFPNQVLNNIHTPTAPIKWPTGVSTTSDSSTAISTQYNIPDQVYTPPPVTDSPQITPTPSDTSPDENQQKLTQYDLYAVLDYFQNSATVSETIHYINHSPDELDNLTLVVEPNLWQGCFSIKSISWENGASIDQYEITDNLLNIPLISPMKPAESLGIRIEYLLVIPLLHDVSDTRQSMPFGYSSRQTNLVDWYPYIPPYRDGEGWLVHSPWPYGEHQVYDEADYHVILSLVEPVQDLLIAASAPADQDGNTYSYHLESARTFALSASTEYLLQTANAGGVTVLSYSFPYDKYAGLEVLQNTVDALQLYSQLIMPYPHSSLSVVEADFLDGMEYEGLFFLSHGFYDLYDGTPKGYLTFIAAHETAHQWWYGLVGNDQALEPWLDEALCTYMEHIFYENVYSEYPPRSGASLVNWWWYYRVDFYNPSGWVDSSIYDFTIYRPYRDSIYLNGARFLEDLRSLIGDQAFFSFLSDYARTYAYGIATTTDFFSVLRKHTTQDLSGLIHDYFQFDR